MFAKQSKRAKKSFEEIFKPLAHQIASIKFCLSRPAAALFLKPGLGKTVILLAVFKILKDRGIVKRMLVVTTRRIMYNVWRQEVEKWNLPFTVEIVHGGYRSKRTGLTKKEQALRNDADIYVINFEAVEWLNKQADRLKFTGQMLVADESAKIKTWMSNRTRAFKEIASLFKRRYIAAANPRPKSMMDIYSQIYMLDFGKALGSGITKFRNKYFYQYGEKEHGLYALLEGAEEKIYKAIEHLAIFFDDDELDLPPMVEVRRTVELPDNARAVYNSLEQNMIAYLKTEAITAANAGVATAKLRQIASGSVYLPYKTKKLDLKKPKRGKFEILHDEKAREVEQLKAELGDRPIFISYEFDHERIALQKIFPKAPAVYSDTTDAAGERIIKQWNQGKVEVLIGQSQSVSHGLNLQDIEASVVYFSFSWDFDAFDQFRRRIWRQGQENPVYVYYIVAEDTIDETMFNVLQLKDADQDKMFKALKKDLLNPHQKGLFTMATSKATAKKRGKKKVTKKKAVTKKRPAKKVAKKKATAKKPARKKAAKRAPRPKGLAKGKHNPTLNRDKNGLRKGSVQATLCAMAMRKNGCTVDEVVKRTGSTPGSVRVNIRLLKTKHGITLENQNGRYRRV